MNTHPTRLSLYRTRIPMRGFEHAAATRHQAESILVRLQCSDGRVGWGETLPRQYVTGETFDSVVTDLAETLWPRFVRNPDQPLPERADDGRIINAAACALSLAWTDATEPFESFCGKRIFARVSGVLGSADPTKTLKRLRLMYTYGLRDFKLKLGLGEEADQANLERVWRALRRGLRRGKCSLRVDVNGGWSLEETPARVATLAAYGVCAVEQPTCCPADRLLALAGQCELPLMADESLLTSDDAELLCEDPRRIWWNVRMSKNGGFWRALHLLQLAARKGVTVSLGCMVGETCILSAAQRRLLQVGPQPRFVEGNYGRFLLADDLCEKSPRFGYGGRLTPLSGPGLGGRVDTIRLDRLAEPLRTVVD